MRQRRVADARRVAETPPEIGVKRTHGRFFREVELELLAQFLLGPATTTPPREPAKEVAHRDSSPGLSSSPIARANASHFDRSLASCFRPSAVIL